MVNMGWTFALAFAVLFIVLLSELPYEGDDE